jgi:hypothetical protein
MTPSPSGTSPLKAYLQDFAKLLPKLDPDGFFYTTTGVSRASVKQRQVLGGSALRRHMKTVCQDGHVHIVPPPRERALEIKGVASWTRELRCQAQRCFQIPRGLRICLCWPDLFERHILRNHSEYCTAEDGILTPCPYCRTHKHVVQNGYTTHERSQRSAIDSKAELTIIVGPWYYCFNPECPGKPGKKEDKPDRGVQSHPVHQLPTLPPMHHISYQQYPHYPAQGAPRAMPKALDTMSYREAGNLLASIGVAAPKEHKDRIERLKICHPLYKK